jgi:hypothetical protein
MCTFSTIRSASMKKNQNITKIAQDMQTSKHHVETLTEHQSLQSTCNNRRGLYTLWYIAHGCKKQRSFLSHTSKSVTTPSDTEPSMIHRLHFERPIAHKLDPQSRS